MKYYSQLRFQDGLAKILLDDEKLPLIGKKSYSVTLTL